MNKIPLSVLELATVVEGGNLRNAIERTVEVAKHTESLGYNRIWMAEHHNIEYIASSATAVLIGQVASKTNTIRVGSGGIMLPNHSPLVIAEQFGTLETIYPGRIDLGLGRAPGTDQPTAMALRRNNMNTTNDFPDDIKQLQTYFSKENSSSKVRAFPGEGLDIPLWILGSSTDSAYLAAQMGLPYAFAAHFAPAQFRMAIDIYRNNFKSSNQLKQPYVMACINVIGAETDEEAGFLNTSLINLFLGLITNMRKPIQPPGLLPASYRHPAVYSAINNMMACTFAGSRDTLRKNLSQFIAETGVDELMISSNIFDREAKMKSFSILQEATD
ncbi:MAG TPA: LLM class flavin-dependent oxidoreductase [Prolixibacteraceae bacterium]|jgi:luciferase family oxidoreductase group 1